MNTHTAAADLLGRLMHYVSVLPRNARAGDTIELGRRVAALRANGRPAADRSLPGSPIVYVFVEADSADHAAALVAGLTMHIGDVIAAGPAADGATRVAIDPALLAA